MRIAIRDWMRRFGATETIAFAALIALVVACLALFLVYTRPVSQIPATVQRDIVPATGEQGFNANDFCSDPRTDVAKNLSPDASGITYEMKRVASGVSETVTVVLAQTGDVLYAKHFWDQSGVQQSEPAFVDDDVKSCLERKS